VKTGSYELAPDQVLEVVQTTEGPMARVHRQLPFIIGPFASHRASTVAVPANGMPIAALKSGEAAKAELPKADEATPWDAAAAVKRLRAWASTDGSGEWDKIDEAGRKRLARAFAYVGDPDDPNAYKLPFADLIDGELTAVWRGVAAAMAALRGSRGGVELPAEARPGVEKRLGELYALFDKPVPGEGEKTEEPVDEHETKQATAHKAAGRVQRFLTWLTGGSDEAPLVLEPTAAEKAAQAEAEARKAAGDPIPTVVTPPVPSVASAFAVDQWRQKWWSLRDVLDSAICDVMFWGQFEGRRAESARQILDEFHAKALQLLAEAQTVGLKSAGESSLPELAGAAKALAEKAGKMISAANLADLQAAASALQAILDRAGAGVQAGEGEAAAGEAGKGCSGDGKKPGEKEEGNEPPAEGEEEEQAMAEKKASEAALQALEAVKSAKSDEERTRALAGLETALKGAADPQAAQQAEMARIAGEAAKAAVAPVLELLELAFKSIPGLELPGDEDPAAALTRPLDSPQDVVQANRTMLDYQAPPASPLGQGAPAPGGSNPLPLLGALKAEAEKAAQAEVQRILGAVGTGSRQPANNAQKGAGDSDAALDSFLRV
jgi:hypothetical protein